MFNPGPPGCVRVGSTEPLGDQRPRLMAVTLGATSMHRIRLIGGLHTFTGHALPIHHQIAAITGFKAGSQAGDLDYFVRVSSGKAEVGAQFTIFLIAARADSMCARG